MPIDRRAAVLKCAQVLADHNGKDTVVLDLTELNTWTDYFVIATATSSAHLGGLARHLTEHLDREGLEPARKPQVANDEEWCLVDVGWFVVHLMSEHARSFYELEKLWFQSSPTPIKPSAPLPGTAAGA